MEVSAADIPTLPGPCTGCRPTTDLLQVRDLTVRFSENGSAFTVVDRVSFDIAPGETLGLLGESGCGKTTIGLSLLRLLPRAAQLSCTSISFRGRDLCSLPESGLREVRGAGLSIIYQDSSVLNPVLRVGTQVSEVLHAHSKCSAGEARERIEAVFAAIGFDEFHRIYDAYPHQLSGGQRQRIAIAQALICEPRLVIADEPTASVDRDTASEILRLMKHLQRNSGTSFLFISHDPATLSAVADRIMVMYAGQMVEDGPTDEVYANPLHPYTAALLQCAPQRTAMGHSVREKVHLPSIPGKSPDPFEISGGCSFANRCRDRMGICDSQSPKRYEISSGRSARCFKHEVR